ncbi:MAG: futalosine hydrolase [Prevotellaceae bacterium]|jgi:futalosine hydrolase|nr:futalosine hydrolase [Prevotellaceae bacterium]
MKILVTAATLSELHFINSSDSVSLANMGIGVVSTMYNLSKLLKNKYDLVLNIGIAGSFSKKLRMGEVVSVSSETFGDFGVAGKDGFTTCFEENIVPADMFPYSNGVLKSVNAWKISKDLSVQSVNGLTNNTVSGEESLIKRMRDKFSPDIETMEGAAFFYVCLMENVPFAEIRAISNMVESRDKSRWDILPAIRNLSDKVNFYLDKICFEGDIL